MEKEIFIAIVVALGFGELILAFVAAALVHKLIDTRNHMDNMIDLTNLITEQHDDIFKQYKFIYSVYQSQNYFYKKIKEQYQLINTEFQSILSQYKELLNALNSIESRYSVVYEQFKHCSDDLKELKEKVDRPFYTGSAEIELEDAS